VGFLTGLQFNEILLLAFVQAAFFFKIKKEGVQVATPFAE
tara:strand:+ start:16174 stop:16293 length:120 start_codon:yes stop_codon:yes gene_type:complete